jgi:hypothetical protein
MALEKQTVVDRIEVTDEEGNVVQEAVTEEYTETVTRKEKQKTPLNIHRARGCGLRKACGALLG